MKEYALAHDVWAMAGVQIGIPKCIIFVKATDEEQSLNEDKSFFLINPVIVNKKGRTQYLEACQSCLEYAGLVERPYEIEVLHQTLNGDIKKSTFSGFSATVVSHEIDHLHGIFHMDRAEQVFKMNVEERVAYREKHPYKIISKDCPFEYPDEKNK